MDEIFLFKQVYSNKFETLLNEKVNNEISNLKIKRFGQNNKKYI